MLINKLLQAGATFIIDPVVYPDRHKAQGQMWDGKCRMKLNDTEFVFQLWHHGSYDETVESLLPHFSLKGIVSKKCGYDTYWHARIVDGGILVHKTGWFRDQELREKIQTAGLDIPELKKLGLKWLVRFK